jgi:ABC-type sugar transport system ATPase subunit
MAIAPSVRSLLTRSATERGLWNGSDRVYPHMSVYDNMAFGLRVRRTPKADIRRQVDRAAAILGLVSELEKKPACGVR